MTQFFWRHKKWLFPVLAMALITPFTPMIDMAVANAFYEQGSVAEAFFANPLLDFIYVYALVPGQLTIIAAAVALTLSYIVPRCRAWRPHALFLVLTLAVGAGFIHEALLKEHWGRPRPKQVVEFGGSQEFRPYYSPNFQQPEPSKSFPSSHTAMGFYFFTFILLGHRFRDRRLLYAGVILTVILGGALAVTRLAQGGHFVSDILTSALIMWLTALTMEWLVYEELGTGQK